MKLSKDSVVPTPNRRSLIMHQHNLLTDPEVVDFLNNAAGPTYDTLAAKLLEANEPALLIELIRMTRRSEVELQVSDINGQPILLPDGLFGHVLQHIDQVPCMDSLIVWKEVLSANTCAQLQIVLGTATCSLKSLTFTNCSFANVNVRFPTTAATIETFDWTEQLPAQVHPSPIDQMLPSLAGWTKLANLTLIHMGASLNFALITQLLLHNPLITTLYLMADVAPVALGQPGHQPEQDPGLLFDRLANDELALTHLFFEVCDVQDINFNTRCLQLLTRCLMTNTTLRLLKVPGFRMSTHAAQQRFLMGLNDNRGLISLKPLDDFNNQVPDPIRRNQSQRFWFSEDFVRGAAEAFLQLFKVPVELGTQLAQNLATTPVERIYCGPVMALICQSTHRNAVKLRSQGLREALKIYILEGKQQRCQDLLKTMVQHRMDLLPEDKQLVIACAREHGCLDFLPKDYAPGAK